MHSMPHPVSCSRSPFSLKRATPTHALAWRRALGETRQRRPDLAADAQNDDIARDCCDIRDERRRWRGHHLFEMVDVAKAIRQNGGGWGRCGCYRRPVHAGQPNEPRLCVTRWILVVRLADNKEAAAAWGAKVDETRAEPVIGPRFARTRWPALRMRRIETSPALDAGRLDDREPLVHLGLVERGEILRRQIARAA